MLPFRLSVVHAGRRLGDTGRIGSRETVLKSLIERFFYFAPLLLPKLLSGFLPPFFLDLVWVTLSFGIPMPSS
jgi:hypothetical protein